MSMTSSRPYLVRALYDWIIDNQCTPYLLVNAFNDQVMVPQNHVNPDGQIVLNISPSAVSDFAMNDDSLCFSARFGGVPTDIFVPYTAVMGIYAKENHQGMMFDPEPETPPPSPLSPEPVTKLSMKSRPSLKVVK
ncbi:MAG: stringent starvation protein B [Candidatus Endobugula sp.]|jgi:stringent starvation protein B